MPNPYFCRVVSNFPYDAEVISTCSLSVFLAFLLWRFDFGKANCVALVLCSAASWAVNSLEFFVLVLGFIGLKLAIAPSAYITNDNELYISYPPDGASFRHWSVLIRSSGMPTDDFSELHVVDDGVGHVSTGRGKLIMTPIKKIHFSAGRKIVFVGYARKDWQKYYAQLQKEIRPLGRIGDNCQDYAISLAFHLSAFRIWTFVLSFKEFRRARVFFVYLPLITLSFFIYCLYRSTVGIMSPCLVYLAGMLNPASIFLAIIITEAERLRMGTSTLNPNVWKYNWATWKRTWTMTKSLWTVIVALSYASIRPWLYKWATPMDFLILFAVLMGVMVWLMVNGVPRERAKHNIRRSKGKEFSSPSPLFDLQKLGGYDPTTQSLRSSSLESFQYKRGIKSRPIGFDKTDLVMASQALPPDKEVLKSFLSATDDLRVYQIGVAFVGNGHAEVVLRHGNLTTTIPFNNLDLTASPPTFSSDSFVLLQNGEISPKDGVYLRVLHLCNAGDETDDLVLALEEVTKVKYYRYADLYRIHTTECLLKHLALLSCPDQHRLVAEDCATFAYNFLTNLLEDLQTRGHINEEVFRIQQRLLVKHNHIMDGSLGESEVTSRQHEVLRESGHSSVAVAIKCGISK